jgi:hypothetical protein
MVAADGVGADAIAKLRPEPASALGIRASFRTAVITRRTYFSAGMVATSMLGKIAHWVGGSSGRCLARLVPDTQCVSPRQERAGPRYQNRRIPGCESQRICYNAHAPCRGLTGDDLSCKSKMRWSSSRKRLVALSAQWRRAYIRRECMQRLPRCMRFVLRSTPPHLCFPSKRLRMQFNQPTLLIANLPSCGVCRNGLADTLGISRLSNSWLMVSLS